MDENKKSGEMLSEQEKFLVGEIWRWVSGIAITQMELLAQKTAFYASVIKGMAKFGSCIEFKAIFSLIYWRLETWFQIVNFQPSRLTQEQLKN